MLQQTPLAVTDAPPSEVTFPPETALFIVILLILFVVTTGKMAAVLNSI